MRETAGSNRPNRVRNHTVGWPPTEAYRVENSSGNSCPHQFSLGCAEYLEFAELRIKGLAGLRRDDPSVLHTGLKMIGAKVGNQASVLRYFAKYRNKTDPHLSMALRNNTDKIRRIADAIRILDVGRASLRATAMGMEGQAGAIYWKQIVKLLPTQFGFRGRIARGAQDPVNQCLNYMYVLLYGEVWHAIARAGLDPYFGMIHGSQRDEGSLVFDLIEEFRAPFVDRLVFAMVGRGFQPEIGSHQMLKTNKRKQLTKCFKKVGQNPFHGFPARFLPVPSSILRPKT